MDQPLAAVVRIATSPEQAKIFVALLQGEGIPAYVEGDSLADEFAMSRRLVNLIATKVMVPTTSLDRARDILTKVEIDPAELEQQALAADGGEQVPVPTPRAPAPARTHSLWPLVIAISAAVVFLGLWLASLEAKAAVKDWGFESLFEFEYKEYGMREIRRSDHRLLRSYEDRNRNANWDRVHMHGHDGKVVATITDENEDGVFERSVEIHDDGLTTTWIDIDGDGRFDEGRTTDTENRLLQTISWQPSVGLVVKKP